MKPATFFQDGTGNYSSMRLMCFLALLVSIAITVYVFIKNDKVLFDTAFAWLISWLSVAFGGKSVQKIIEVAPSFQKIVTKQEPTPPTPPQP